MNGGEQTDRISTGNAAVDSVIDAVADLGERPLEEHPAVFEAAHDTLRRALDPADPAVPAPTTP